ncbi:hypothetical protein [Urechidicola croceus]|uniref:DUF2007 domain-containing protein n=1 Tax=Urechidicola croceus TaxID=1850246 RepID=A0A1D8P7G6_9FLAO|nr:hypothetical protein [Urechidicola croceus]AOW20523.1 hypothetical protein LPB138_07465 [Urechidicola croceus]
METSSNKLVTVLSSAFLHEIQIAKSKLQSEGIQSFIPDENMALIGFVENYRLQIRSFDVMRAKLILNSILE